MALARVAECWVESGGVSRPPMWTLALPLSRCMGGPKRGLDNSLVAIDPRCRVRFGNFYRDLIQLGFMWGLGQAIWAWGHGRG
jgi:hypothetical protein